MPSRPVVRVRALDFSHVRLLFYLLLQQRSRLSPPHAAFTYLIDLLVDTLKALFDLWMVSAGIFFYLLHLFACPDRVRVRHATAFVSGRGVSVTVTVFCVQMVTSHLCMLLACWAWAIAEIIV